MPRLERERRQDVARLIAHVIPDDNDDYVTGGDRAALVVQDVAGRGATAETIIAATAASLGLSDAEARRILSGGR